MSSRFTTIGSKVGILMEDPEINPTTKECIIKFKDEDNILTLIFEDDKAPEFVKSQKKGNKICIIGLFSDTGKEITVWSWKPYLKEDYSSANIDSDEIPF